MVVVMRYEDLTMQALKFDEIAEMADKTALFK